MFGHATDPYRGNTTPQQRVWRAEDRLKDAKNALEQAQKDYDEAVAELLTFSSREQRQVSRGLF